MKKYYILAVREKRDPYYHDLMRIYPRKQADLSWNDIAWVIFHILIPRSLEESREQVAKHWVTPQEIVPCFSARTALHLLLCALKYPPGTEVLMSEITIPHVVELLKLHGLTVVPVKVDSSTLEPCLNDLSEKISPRTKMCLLTHLFGNSFDVRPFAELCREKNILIVEDCAQSFRGVQDTFNLHADVSFTSFGMIKTSTALGGAVMRIKCEKLRAQVEELERALPQLPRKRLLRRAAIGVLWRCASSPTAFGVLARVMKLLGKDIGAIMTRYSRSFPGSNLLDQISFRLPNELSHLLARRLVSFSPASIRKRAQVGAEAAKLFQIPQLVGCAASKKTFWVFPVFAEAPQAASAALYRAGYDAAATTSSLAYFGTSQEHWLAKIVYLPVYPAMSLHSLQRMSLKFTEAADHYRDN